MIELKHVSKKYKDKVALEDCSLQIPKGQVIGLVAKRCLCFLIHCLSLS